MTKLLSLLVVSVLLLTACSTDGVSDDGYDVTTTTPAPTTPPPDEETPAEPDDNQIPPDAERVGMAYTDPFIKMTVYLNNPDWVWTKGEIREIVYFFNRHDETGENLISISSFDYDGDLAEISEDFWKQTSKNVAVNSKAPITYEDRESITVAQIYGGYHYKAELELPDNDIYMFQNLFWYAEGRVYQCIVSGTLQGFQEVQDVLDGILDLFMPITD